MFIISLCKGMREILARSETRVKSTEYLLHDKEYLKKYLLASPDNPIIEADREESGLEVSVGAE